ncbi:hypothetical protein QP794_28090 [Paenibacillus sp. UMB7766-LJ446]|uniref:hypothetical protein n=1 Tax=Paenibacillus sp. UMB7766-LJ446 TaxID=3046313 RepID=UPI00254D1741|nr:hypothetical protein [Paenibacillus sp. UMB7766-LJ446]MDK8193948.1 hypothetical protein [Paenibacillus sp. UMB7766-LJ446]
MNKKVKMLSAALCTALAITSLAPVAFASSATPSPSIELPKGEFNLNKKTIVLGEDEFSKKVLNSIESMTPYINKGSDNLYHIDPAAQGIVEQDVYNHFATGVQNLNAAVNSEVSTSNGQVVTPFTFANSYWWGVAITFNNQETNDMIYALQQTAQVAVLLAAIAGFIPGGQIGAVVALIEGAGFSMIANSMSHNNAGKGVTLNLHWLPITYYEVTTNKG